MSDFKDGDESPASGPAWRSECGDAGPDDERERPDDEECPECLAAPCRCGEGPCDHCHRLRCGCDDIYESWRDAAVDAGWEPREAARLGLWTRSTLRGEK